MNNMLIAQSGGPTAAINASLAGAIKRAMKYTQIDNIYGAFNGIMGVLNERFVDLRPLFVSEDDFAHLKRTPAMALGSCRKRLAAQPDADYEKIRDIFRDLANPANYPMYMHCTYGLDRTGTVCYLLEALLGADETDLIRDYELSALYHGHASGDTLDPLHTTLETYDGNNLSEKVASYLLSTGVTAEEIASIRSIFLEP